MSTMTDTTERDKMLASLASLLERAESTDPDELGEGSDES